MAPRSSHGPGNDRARRSISPGPSTGFELAASRHDGPIVAAFAEGYGPALADDLKIGDPDGLVFRLAADDVPITGRLDRPGRPWRRPVSRCGVHPG